MNGIIHNCSHPNDDDIHFRISEEQIIKDIFNYIEFLFNIIKPKKVFFMAVDGVAPRAKMNNQRGRRFKSAQEAMIKQQEAIRKGQTLPKEARFDSNCITPGTEFMQRLHSHLKYFVVSKLSSDPNWCKCEIILSGHETPGEGEHKIMDFIRYRKSQPNYDPNVRHCLYGLDADLIMLGLASHEPHFSLLREEINFSKSKKKTIASNPYSLNFHLLHLSLFRDYLDHEFFLLKTTLSFGYNLESVIDDWILMGFLCGNDFIPQLPHFNIHKNILSKIYSIYQATLPELGGYLNEQGKLNVARFEKFCAKLAELDYENFSEINADLKYMESKRKGAAFNYQYKEQNQEMYDDLPMIENQLSTDLNLIALDSDDDISNQDIDYFESEEENNLADEEFVAHKKDYYKSKLMCEKVDESVLKEQARCYIRALQWNLHYYYDGCKSWSWYYPHHYAPYISDIKDFGDIDLNFDLSEPFKPYEQLLAVLPSASSNLLPRPYQRLLTDSNSPIIEYYPEKIDFDLNGKTHTWEAIVLIAFIDEKKLLSAAKSCESQLTETQRKGNQHGPHLRFTYNAAVLQQYSSSWPNVFSDIINNHANMQELDINAFQLPIHKIKKGLYLGVKLDVHFPGFPTLKHIEHRAFLSKHRVKVFEMPSQDLNIILQIKGLDNVNLNEIVESYLGKEIYVNWPHLVEAKVAEISDGRLKFTLKNNTVVKSEMDEKAHHDYWENIVNIDNAFQEKKGIIIGETKVVLFVHLLTGYRYVSQSPTSFVLEKLWDKKLTNCPIQTVVKDIAVHAPDYQKVQTIEDVFTVGRKCFLLHDQFYGDMGEIIGYDKTGKIKVRISREEEPDMTDVKHNIKDIIDNEYMTHSVIAQRLQLNANLIARITGSIIVRQGENRVNIGLNLKNNTKREEVPGYSKKKGDFWLFSHKTLETLEEYQAKFPYLFHLFNSILVKDIYEAKEFFGSENW